MAAIGLLNAGISTGDILGRMHDAIVIVAGDGFMPEIGNHHGHIFDRLLALRWL